VDSVIGVAASAFDIPLENQMARPEDRQDEGDRSGGALTKPLKTALKEAGIEKRFTIHGFRRTFNNLLRQATTGEVVRSMTGHVTERMTEHYSHIESHEKRAAVVRAFAPFTKGLVTNSRASHNAQNGTSRAGETRAGRDVSRAQVGTKVGTSALAPNVLARTAPLSVPDNSAKNRSGRRDLNPSRPPFLCWRYRTSF
jgi:hypothetical protein